MKKFIYLFLLFLVISCKNNPKEKFIIREPKVAGGFYPANKKELETQIDNFLKAVKRQEIEGELIALISPHAGYIYSGPIAAYSYKQLIDKEFDTVIIIGPSHHVSFYGISIFNGDYYETPLGKVVIDKELTKILIEKIPNPQFIKEAEKYEHSVEVQVPFLQTVLKKFKMVDILTGQVSYEYAKVVAKVLADEIRKSKKKILLIASTDMSHYHPYDEANRIDAITLKLLQKFAIDDLVKGLNNRSIELCGQDAVIITLLTAKKLGANIIKVLKYANSGDTAGDKLRVVGYCAVAISKKGRSNKKMVEIGFRLTDDEKKLLLKIARDTIEEYIRNGKKIKLEKPKSKNLNTDCGAFVTLRKNHELRGCIGNLTATMPLYLTIQEMAISAAVRDSRFLPVDTSELKDIKIEISVLSPLKKITDPNIIIPGVHGVLVEKGFRSGVFLPQVATEQGWDREEFLTNLCAHKAGLPPYAWRDDKDLNIYIFTAEVFDEEQFE